MLSSVWVSQYQQLHNARNVLAIFLLKVELPRDFLALLTGSDQQNDIQVVNGLNQVAVPQLRPAALSLAWANNSLIQLCKDEEAFGTAQVQMFVQLSSQHTLPLLDRTFLPPLLSHE